MSRVRAVCPEGGSIWASQRFENWQCHFPPVFQEVACLEEAWVQAGAERVLARVVVAVGRSQWEEHPRCAHQEPLPVRLLGRRAEVERFQLEPSMSEGLTTSAGSDVPSTSTPRRWGLARWSWGVAPWHIWGDVPRLWDCRLAPVVGRQPPQDSSSRPLRNTHIGRRVVTIRVSMAPSFRMPPHAPLEHSCCVGARGFCAICSLRPVGRQWPSQRLRQV